ncbi:MAG: ImmA/IrrE family metallo-endopeptidase, partial [Ekhidna sp.]|nr:ImmA/IrrE family metallo-endopeptidase [Ekhidna sp.]
MKTTPNRRKAEKEARRILDSYNFLENPEAFPFEEILAFEGAFLRTRKMEGALGQMIRTSKKRGIISISNQLTYLPRRRFVIAHEFGHWMLHRQIQDIFSCNTQVFQQWHKGSSPYEIEANVFAAELLMPPEKFKALAAGQALTRCLVENLSEALKTSLTATSIRLTKYGPYPLMVVFSQDATVKWSIKSDDFALGLYENNFRVPARTLTYSLYQG